MESCDDEVLNLNNIRNITRKLKRDQFSVKNRLQSILYDAQFIRAIAYKLDRVPLVANERCGLWYVPSELCAQTSYFKSTDGHTNMWTFSLRRLNLHLLSLLSLKGAIAIVDSTRKGKLIPDALSKTIPIWCAVINSVLFHDYTDSQLIDHLSLQENDDASKFILALKHNKWLSVPKIVSENEANEIRKRIDTFRSQVVNLNLFSSASLEKVLTKKKPLVPMWLVNGSSKIDQINDSIIEKDYFYGIVCVTSSVRMKNEETRMNVKVYNEGENPKVFSWPYIQGSGDDHELWITKDICGGKITPMFFWDTVVKSGARYGIIDEDSAFVCDHLGDEELIEKLNTLYNDYSEDKSTVIDISCVRDLDSDTKMAFGVIKGNIEYSNFVEMYPDFHQVVIFSSEYKLQGFDKSSFKVFHYNLDSSKKSAKELRKIYPKLVPKLDITKPLAVLCESGNDLSAGLILVLMCQNFDLDWKLADAPKIDKDLVRKHLNKLNNVRKINPSRNTLQSVNTYLMRAV